MSEKNLHPEPEFRVTSKRELDIEGDLILREHMSSFASIRSRNGSILVEKGVSIFADEVHADRILRIEGSLTASLIQADKILLERGAVSCEEVEAKNLVCRDSRLESRNVSADSVKVRGGELDVGTISSKTLTLQDFVKGTIVSSSGSECHVDETVQAKIGLMSSLHPVDDRVDSETTGDEQVVHRLRARKGSSPLKRFLLRESAPTTLEADASTRDVKAARASEDVTQNDLLNSLPLHYREHLDKLAEELIESLTDIDSTQEAKRLMLTTLCKADVDTLQSIMARWAEVLEDIGEEKTASR